MQKISYTISLNRLQKMSLNNLLFKIKSLSQQHELNLIQK